MAVSDKKHLVAVRAGETSLHAGWLDMPYGERSFDMIVSYYSAPAFSRHVAEEGVVAILVAGGKWDGLHRSFAELGTDLGRYDFVWLPDDDIETSGRTIERIFELARCHGLAVCQPSLTHDSFYSYFPLLQCDAFRLRYTNLVEIMVPCLSRDMQARALPLFKDTMSGFGLDYVWCRWPESGAFRAAILDEVAVFHTRPVGKHLKSIVATDGRNEEAELQARFQIPGRVIPITYAGISRTGVPVVGRRAMAATMARCWLSQLDSFADQATARRMALQVLKRQFLKPLDLSPMMPPQPLSLMPPPPTTADLCYQG